MGTYSFHTSLNSIDYNDSFKKNNGQSDLNTLQPIDATKILYFLKNKFNHIEQSALVWLKNNNDDVIGIYPKWTISSELLTDITSASVINKIDIRHRVISTTEISSKNTPFFSYTIKSTACAINDVSKNISLSIDTYINRQKVSNPKQEAQITCHFTGGLIGFVGYDFSATYTAPNITINKNNSSTSFEAKAPQLFFGDYDIYLKKINTEHSFYWQLHFPDNLQDSDFIQELISFLQEIILPTNSSLKDNTTLNKTNNFQISEPNYNWSSDDYSLAFNQIQDYLTAGDCYQVNLAQRVSANFTGDAINLLSPLEHTTNAPYAGYLSFDSFELISCSPELFVEFKRTPQGSREIITKPIKGTLPRLNDTNEDNQQKLALKHSEKNISENLMIVDLLRNDLSVYAKTGTVNVPKLFDIESFEQVHHMVSTISAELKDSVSSFDVYMTALPGGSITGAPKVRSIEIINELEQQARGAYCGSMGFLNFDGTGSFNILIRTIQCFEQQLSVWAGGGITIASDCAEEYQECFDKISGIMSVLETFITDNNE